MEIAIVLNYAVLYFGIVFLGTISGIFSERVGIVNIAINGFLVFGAISYFAFSILFGSFIEYDKNEGLNPWYQIPIVILSSLSSGIFALLFGFATIKLKSEQTISGFALNILSAGITGILIIFFITFQRASSVTLPFKGELAWNTYSGSFKNLVSLKVFLSVVIGFVCWFALRKTRWGLRFRAIGENPQAADVAGINVNAKKWQGVILAGIIAGVGGTIFAQSSPTVFSSTKDVDGLGYIALAIMITSRWRISISVIVGLLFSLLISLATYGIIIFGEVYEPYKTLLKGLPYLITLILITFQSKNSFAPAAAGIPYDKSQR
ncbi:ABC transporter permease [Mycoplasmopsis ciconiae]|uniref:ABC transporter permease n=1 Tax=Mycoplasmopsis ciconiae TaxID=561067 RepID=A0ABU7MN96_9BACT|nr:ABC transporter permease [Mycoplasmopsis ciconiae]